ncbi:MAG: hypothetical protein BroJett011_03340 [Chloroflexota bacterium]|nr:MAG: hypothetical protein BroJett011_03340 [Chloroflexota bacterium]
MLLYHILGQDSSEFLNQTQKPVFIGLLAHAKFIDYTSHCAIIAALSILQEEKICNPRLTQFYFKQAPSLFAGTAY